MTYPTLLSTIAAMPESDRMQLVADMLQPTKGSPVAWSDFAADALLPLSDALDANWRTYEAAMTYASPCFVSGRDGVSDPFFAGAGA